MLTLRYTNALSLLLCMISGCSSTATSRFDPLAGPSFKLPYQLPDGSSIVDFSFREGSSQRFDDLSVVISYTAPGKPRKVSSTTLRRGSSFRGYQVTSIQLRPVTLISSGGAAAGTAAYEARFELPDRRLAFHLEEMAGKYVVLP